MINGIYRLLDAFSLSGAIILMFSGITIYGIALNNEKVWTTGFTALTTFTVGKSLKKTDSEN